MLDVDRMRQLHDELAARNQALVEIAPETRWERPSFAIGRTDTPTSGYALCSITMSRVLHERRAYVSDINHDHKWRRLYAVYASLEDAADAVLAGVSRR